MSTIGSNTIRGTGQPGHRAGGLLVPPQWLQEHLHDPGLRIVEVDVSPAAYNRGHIEGAVPWIVYTDLKDSTYHLASPAALEDLIARSGISPGSTVVVYGYAPAMGLWLLKLYGHADVRILDCARGTWRDEGRPWTALSPQPAITRYRLPVTDGRIWAGHQMVASAMADPARVILDVRTGPEFRGECFWPSGGTEPGGRAGHVPTAVNLPLDGLYDDRGAFTSDTALRRIFESAELAGDSEIIAYCTIGARASTAWFVLTHLLGRDNVRVYEGSWAEWGKRPEVPVEAAP